MDETPPAQHTGKPFPSLTIPYKLLAAPVLVEKEGSFLSLRCSHGVSAINERGASEDATSDEDSSLCPACLAKREEAVASFMEILNRISTEYWSVLYRRERDGERLLREGLQILLSGQLHSQEK